MVSLCLLSICEEFNYRNLCVIFDDLLICRQPFLFTVPNGAKKECFLVRANVKHGSNVVKCNMNG